MTAAAGLLQILYSSIVKTAGKSLHWFSAVFQSSTELCLSSQDQGYSTATALFLSFFLPFCLPPNPTSSIYPRLVSFFVFAACVCLWDLAVFALTACLSTVHLPERQLKPPWSPRSLPLRCLFARRQFPARASCRRNKTEQKRKTTKTKQVRTLWPVVLFKQ